MAKVLLRYGMRNTAQRLNTQRSRDIAPHFRGETIG